MRKDVEHQTELSRHEINPLDEILGISSAIQQTKALIKQVAASEVTVLISGESGTGKELVANAIHQLSARKKRPLIPVNCGAIPEGIFESEIFGHEKGSFTSAVQKRQGYFEMADGGSLFLDEIGEMPLKVQVKILRVLETGSFMRVGGSSEVKVDVRIIAATNKDLGSEVIHGRFREDLFYRLKAVNIAIPPLRERSDDIPILTENFARLFARKNNRPEPIFDTEVLEILRRQYWAGNVRELKNFVESLIALGQHRIITAGDTRSRLGYEIGSANLPVIVNRPSLELDQELIYRTLLDLRHEMNSVRGLLQQLLHGRTEALQYQEFSAAEEAEAYSLDELEKEQIKRTLANFNGNRKRAAQALGIGERTLYRKIKQYNIK